MTRQGRQLAKDIRIYLEFIGLVRDSRRSRKDQPNRPADAGLDALRRPIHPRPLFGTAGGENDA